MSANVFQRWYQTIKNMTVRQNPLVVGALTAATETAEVRPLPVYEELLRVANELARTTDIIDSLTLTMNKVQQAYEDLYAEFERMNQQRVADAEAARQTAWDKLTMLDKAWAEEYEDLRARLRQAELIIEGLRRSKRKTPKTQKTQKTRKTTTTSRRSR